jgi:hypothetical protein
MNDNDSVSAPGVADADLVALVHGELTPDEATALRARLRGDAGARARLSLLTAADRALGDALERPGTPRAAGPGWRALAAAAAVGVVVLLVVLESRPQDRAAARNELVELHVAPRGGASAPLFSDAEFELRWRGRGARDGGGWRLASVFPYRPIDMPARYATYVSPDKVPAMVAATADRSETAGKVLPLLVSARLIAPDGTATDAWLSPEPSPEKVTEFDCDGETVQRVRLSDFQWQNPAVRPFLAGAPGDREGRDDFMWPFVKMPEDKPQRWIPDQPGEWRVQLSVDTLPDPPTRKAPWPRFREPLRVDTAIVLTGIASAWSEPVDGMRARIVVATGVADPDHAGFAVQIRNESGRLRRYNASGTTQAPIPQPLHYALVVDGDEWRQPETLAAITPANSLNYPHPDGAVRTLLGRADYWRRDGKGLAAAPGRHRLQMRFHVQMTVWDPKDRELWQGDLLTPAVEFVVPPR